MVSFTPSLTRYHTVPSIKSLDLSATGMDALIAFGESHRTRYLSNVPFPHIIIDNLFPPALLVDVLTDIEHLEHSIVKCFHGSVKKSATPDPQAMGPTVRQFLLDLCSARFCQFLEALTGIDGLIPDPYFEGGGVHEITQGGFLKMHTDFNWHDKLKLDRRLNMLIYLNSNWEEHWGGHLELWGSDLEQQFVKISPAFNTTVIFSTTDYSFHGHPNPLECPEAITRKSLALYYYSNGRPTREVRFPHSARTHYRERPGETFLPRSKPLHKKVSAAVLKPARQVKQSVKGTLPKPLLELYRAGKRSLRG